MRSLRPPSLETMLLDRLSALAQVRTQRASTRHGTRQILGATTDVLVYKDVDAR